MNFILITTIVLSLSNPFGIGLSGFTVSDTATTQFNELQLQAQQELKAEFTASVTSGEAPLTVSFDASTSTGEGELTYEWWLGGGSSKVGNTTAEHTFKYPGDYVVLLVVSDGVKQASKTVQISVTGDRAKGTLQLPYSINHEELGDDADNIFNGISTVTIKYLDTVPVHNFKAGIITFLTLYDNNDEAIAEEAVVPSIKENIHFDAANTVKADALHLLFQLDVPYSDLSAIYPLIELHPSYDEAVSRVKELKGLRSIGIDYVDPDLARLIAKIGFEVGRKYFIDNGTVNPDQLNPVESE